MAQNKLISGKKLSQHTIMQLKTVRSLNNSGVEKFPNLGPQAQ